MWKTAGVFEDPRPASWFPSWDQWGPLTGLPSWEAAIVVPNRMLVIAAEKSGAIEEEVVVVMVEVGCCIGVEALASNNVPSLPDSASKNSSSPDCVRRLLVVGVVVRRRRAGKPLCLCSPSR